MDPVAEERMIAGDGTSEAVWLPWLHTLAVPRLHVPSAQRLVVVAPHPDDEVLACGGLIAMHAQHGGTTIIVAVTDGEASHPDDPAWPVARLTAERHQERLRGLSRLGVQTPAVLRLGLPDGQVEAEGDTLSAALAELLQPDDIVVTTSPLDGHPDHEATGMRTARACRAANCHLLEAPVWLWHWGEPGDRRIPWSHLRVVPLDKAARRAKLAALAEHVTQHLAAPHGRPPVLGPAILQRAARDVEYFFI
jgi:LmbE family N-acetylglucosaminyl deacetylase